MSDSVIICDSVGKKFCRDFKKSLWYGLKDSAADLLGLNRGVGATTSYPQNSASESNTDVDPVLRSGEFWSNKSISFELKPGDCLGLIGRNGAGKTTLLKMLNGLIKPDQGRITMKGRVGAMIALGAGFNPILTGRENIFVAASVLGISKAETAANLERIVEFSELPEFIDSPVRTYSSGMQVRLGYAVAACLRPDILLVDEVLAVGDAGFKRKCMDNMRDYVRSGGCLILVSHDMQAIQGLCDTCALLDQGRLRFLGPTPEAIKDYYSLQHADPQEDGTCRPGTPTDRDPVVIEDVRVTSPNGGPLVTGQPMHVTLHYNSIRSFNAIDWGISIWSDNLQVRIGTATMSWSSQSAPLQQGRGTLECTISATPLLGNKYSLRAGIYDLDHSWPIARIGWDDPPVPFLVESPAEEAFNRRIAAGDLMVLDAEWRS